MTRASLIRTASPGGATPSAEGAVVRSPDLRDSTRLAPTEDLDTRLRPKRLEDMLGNEAVCASLAKLNPLPHKFLFTGPSGVGKTTLARILALRLGCERMNIIEVDGARYSKVEDMRSVLDTLQYRAITDNPNKMVIVDEAHAISGNAWKSLLKSLEEPPPHVYWCICTTEPEKVPDTVRTRCHAYDLKPIRWDVLATYLEKVACAESMVIETGMYDVIARRSQGSVRQALVFLSILNGIIGREHALRLLDESEDQQQGPIALARMVVSGKGFTWNAARELLAGMQDVSAETIRLTVVAYAATAVAGEKDEKRAVHLLNIVSAFSTPVAYHASEKHAPLYLALGMLLFQG